MPELAEVEHYRRQWDPGVGQRILRVAVHPKARIFRGIDLAALEQALTKATLRSSQARGKQMIFRFTGASLGIHLGMTGELRCEGPKFEPGKHDHLVLFQNKQALVFNDPRLFGRVLFHPGPGVPDWWEKLPPDILSADFSKEAVAAFLQRRKAAPLKAVLLMQERFFGVGNWMADEILWRARLHPATHAGKLTPAETATLWKTTRQLCREALTLIGARWDDPPDTWLFNHRWEKGGICPRCGMELKRREIGGRTTCWCPKCQKESQKSRTRGTFR